MFAPTNGFRSSQPVQQAPARQAVPVAFGSSSTSAAAAAPAQHHEGGIPASSIVHPGSHLRDYECGICMDLSMDPVVTPCCHHVLCKRCIAGQRVCPFDRAPFGPAPLRSLKDAQPVAYRTWSSTQVRCPYSFTRNCTWTGLAEGYQAHLAACGAMSASARGPDQQKEIAARDAAIAALRTNLDARDALISSLRREMDASVLAHQRTIEACDATIGGLRSELEAARLTLSQQQAASSQARVQVDRTYQYDKHKIIELAKLIMQDLEHLPPSIDTNRVFNCIRSLHSEYKRWRQCDEEDQDPQYMDIEFRMLLATALRSAWFSDKQYEIMGGML